MLFELFKKAGAFESFLRNLHLRRFEVHYLVIQLAHKESSKIMEKMFHVSVKIHQMHCWKSFCPHCFRHLRVLLNSLCCVPVFKRLFRALCAGKRVSTRVCVCKSITAVLLFSTSTEQSHERLVNLKTLLADVHFDVLD